MNIQEAQRLRDTGLTLQEIGSYFGVSRQAVHDALGNTGRGSPRHVEAMTIRVCEHCGTVFERPARRARHTPLRFCGNACAAKNRAMLTPERIEKIIDLRRRGLSQRAIGKQVGVSQQAVSRALRQHAVPARAEGQEIQP